MRQSIAISGPFFEKFLTIKKDYIVISRLNAWRGRACRGKRDHLSRDYTLNDLTYATASKRAYTLSTLFLIGAALLISAALLYFREKTVQQKTEECLNIV